MSRSSFKTSFRKIAILSSAVLILLDCAIGMAAQSNRADDTLYDDLRTIKGKVTILNHPSLGKTEGRNFAFILQRVDCRKCYVSVQSDSDGNFAVTVSRGKYRVISRAPAVTNGKTFDWIKRSQRRLVDASGANLLIVFNLEIVLPPG